MKKPILSITAMLLTACVFGQVNWKPLPEIQSLFIKNFASCDGDYFIVAAGPRTTSMNAVHILKINNKDSEKESINSMHEAYDVHQVDSKHMWVCGYKGLISHSNMYGNNGSWNIQNSGTEKNLNALWFTDLDHGWAVGDGGAIIHTSDGGKTWSTQNSSSTDKLVDVQFMDNNTGWALIEPAANFNGKVLITNNGGRNWSITTFKTNLSNMSMHRLFFIDENRGWICGDFLSVYKTTNGGQSWFVQKKPDYSIGYNVKLNEIYFLDKNEGWTCGDKGHLFHTKNGGNSWQKVDIGETIHLTAIAFKGPHFGMLAAGNKVYVHYDREKFEQYRQDFNRNIHKKETIPDQQFVPPPDKHSETPSIKTSYTTAAKGNNWEVRTYDIKSIEDACRELTKENSMPVGITLDNQKMEVLILNRDPFEVSDWKLERYTSISDITPKVSGMMESGYLPLGMTLEDKNYYFLFAKTNFKTTAWQIVESDLDHQDVANDIQPYLEQNYIPLAVSILAEQWFYTLLVQFDSFPASSWSLQGYTGTGSAQMINGINSEIGNGSSPMGYLSVGNIINVLYLRMTD
ncbi:MAG: hypothetical protein K9H13_04760 [Bacteroidales bacterium]|nr:hypothetical protein [Bacteroidales bacterium]